MEREVVIKSCVLFKDWSKADITALAKNSSEHVLLAGQSVFYEGEAPKSLYVIESGTAVIKKANKSGDDTKVANFNKGNHFGELGILDQQKRSASVEMSESGEILEIPYSAIHEIIAKIPQSGVLFYKELALTLATRISKTNEDLASFRSLRLRSV